MNIISEIQITDPVVHLLGDWSAELNGWSIGFRILIALVLSAIIGCERSSKRHSAGLRTFMLVCLASTIGMLIDIYVGARYYFISAAIVVGSATICVNSMIYSSKNQIRGLTTSVGLWAVAIIGLAIGAGLYTATLISFIALLFCLSLFPKFERYLKDRSNHFEMHLELKSSSNLQAFVTTIRELGLVIDEIEANPAYVNSGMSVYSVAVTINSKELKKYKTHIEIIEALRSLDYVYYLEEMN